MLPKNPKTVSDLMTRKIYTIGPDDTLENLEGQMTRFRFRHLPVVSEAKLVGLVSHRDILHASSSFLSDHENARNEIIHKVPVSRIMQSEVLSVRPDEPLVEAGRLMWEGKIGCLPVTEEDGTLIGIVTEADFIRLAVHLLGAEIGEA